MTSMDEDVDDRFAGIDIDALLNKTDRKKPTYRKPRNFYEAPEFIRRLNGEETVMEGQSLCLECKVIGFPAPTLRWFKDSDEIIDDHPRISVDSDGTGFYALTITDVNKGDEAAYRCRAENIEGSSSCFFFLSVRCKPRNRKRGSRSSAKKRNVSFPPMFSTIVEKVEEEDKQGKEFEMLPPSPLTQFYYALTLKGRQSWPSFLGDWAYVNVVVDDDDDDDDDSDDVNRTHRENGFDDGSDRYSHQRMLARRHMMRKEKNTRCDEKRRKLEEAEERRKKEKEEEIRREEEDKKRRETEDMARLEEKRKEEEEENERRRLADKEEETRRRQEAIRQRRLKRQQKREEEEEKKQKEEEEKKREEELRRQEEDKLCTEELRIQEEKRMEEDRKQEELIKKEEEKTKEEMRKNELEERRKEEGRRKEEERREEERKKEVERKKEEESQKEEERKKYEKKKSEEEQQRQRREKEQIEEARRKEEDKLQEKKRNEEERRKAEEKRKEEQIRLKEEEEVEKKRLAEQRKKDEERLKLEKEERIKRDLKNTGMNKAKLLFDDKFKKAGEEKGKVHSHSEAMGTRPKIGGDKSVLQKFAKHMDTKEKSGLQDKSHTNISLKGNKDTSTPITASISDEEVGEREEKERKGQLEEARKDTEQKWRREREEKERMEREEKEKKERERREQVERVRKLKEEKELKERKEKERREKEEREEKERREREENEKRKKDERERGGREEKREKEESDRKEREEKDRKEKELKERKEKQEKLRREEEERLRKEEKEKERMVREKEEMIKREAEDKRKREELEREKRMKEVALQEKKRKDEQEKEKVRLAEETKKRELEKEKEEEISKKHEEERKRKEGDILKEKQMQQKQDLLVKEEHERVRKQQQREQKEKEDKFRQFKKEKIRLEQLQRQYEEEKLKKGEREELRKKRMLEEAEMKRQEIQKRADLEKEDFEVKIYKRDYTFSDLRKSLETRGGSALIDEDEHKYWDDILEKHEYSISDLKKSFDMSASLTLDRPGKTRARRNSIEDDTSLLRLKRSGSLSDIKDAYTKSLDRPKKKASESKKGQKDEELLKRASTIDDIKQSFTASSSAVLSPNQHDKSPSGSNISSSSSSLSSAALMISKTHSALQTHTELSKLAVNVKAKRASFHEIISQAQALTQDSKNIRDLAKKRASVHYGSSDIPMYRRLSSWSDDVLTDVNSRNTGNISSSLSSSSSSSLRSPSSQRGTDAGVDDSADGSDCRVRPFVYNSIRTTARRGEENNEDNDNEEVEEEEEENPEEVFEPAKKARVNQPNPFFREFTKKAKNENDKSDKEINRAPLTDKNQFITTVQPEEKSTNIAKEKELIKAIKDEPKDENYKRRQKISRICLHLSLSDSRANSDFPSPELLNSPSIYLETEMDENSPPVHDKVLHSESGAASNEQDVDSAFSGAVSSEIESELNGNYIYDRDIEPSWLFSKAIVPNCDGQTFGQYQDSGQFDMHNESSSFLLVPGRDYRGRAVKARMPREKIEFLEGDLEGLRPPRESTPISFDESDSESSEDLESPTEPPACFIQDFRQNLPFECARPVAHAPTARNRSDQVSYDKPTSSALGNDDDVDLVIQIESNLDNGERIKSITGDLISPDSKVNVDKANVVEFQTGKDETPVHVSEDFHEPNQNHIIISNDNPNSENVSMTSKDAEIPSNFSGLVNAENGPTAKNDTSLPLTQYERENQRLKFETISTAAPGDDLVANDNHHEKPSTINRSENTIADSAVPKITPRTSKHQLDNTSSHSTILSEKIENKDICYDTQIISANYADKTGTNITTPVSRHEVVKSKLPQPDYSKQSKTKNTDRDGLSKTNSVFLSRSDSSKIDLSSSTKQTTSDNPTSFLTSSIPQINSCSPVISNDRLDTKQSIQSSSVIQTHELVKQATNTISYQKPPENDTALSSRPKTPEHVFDFQIQSDIAVSMSSVPPLDHKQKIKYTSARSQKDVSKTEAISKPSISEKNSAKEPLPQTKVPTKQSNDSPEFNTSGIPSSARVQTLKTPTRSSPRIISEKDEAKNVVDLISKKEPSAKRNAKDEESWHKNSTTKSLIPKMKNPTTDNRCSDQQKNVLILSAESSSHVDDKPQPVKKVDTKLQSKMTGKTSSKSAKRSQSTSGRVKRVSKTLSRCSPFGHYTLEATSVICVITFVCLYAETGITSFMFYIIAFYYTFCVLRILRVLH